MKSAAIYRRAHSHNITGRTTTATTVATSETPAGVEINI
tara:strand:+ start:27 stop:143 length:117 start_codon:yes stop_codon:yes gene_type:complete